MSDYELSKLDFEIINVVFHHFLERGAVDPVIEMKVRDLYEKFRLAHTARIIYE